MQYANNSRRVESRGVENRGVESRELEIREAEIVEARESMAQMGEAVSALAGENGMLKMTIQALNERSSEIEEVNMALQRNLRFYMAQVDHSKVTTPRPDVHERKIICCPSDREIEKVILGIWELERLKKMGYDIERGQHVPIHDIPILDDAILHTNASDVRIVLIDAYTASSFLQRSKNSPMRKIQEEELVRKYKAGQWKTASTETICKRLRDIYSLVQAFQQDCLLRVVPDLIQCHCTALALFPLRQLYTKLRENTPNHETPLNIISLRDRYEEAIRIAASPQPTDRLTNERTN
jgi:hypothetical protein